MRCDDDTQDTVVPLTQAVEALAYTPTCGLVAKDIVLSRIPPRHVVAAHHAHVKVYGLSVKLRVELIVIPHEALVVVRVLITRHAALYFLEADPAE